MAIPPHLLPNLAALPACLWISRKSCGWPVASLEHRQIAAIAAAVAQTPPIPGTFPSLSS